MKKILISIRSDILVLLTHKIALPLLKVIRRPNVFTYTMGQLMLLPQGSLGNDLFQFLENKLDFFVIFFDFFGTKSGFSRIVSNQKTCGNSGGSKQVI